MGERLVTSLLRPPIIIVDRDGVDLVVYGSIYDAELHLEAVDVLNNEYVGYDADGRLLRLRARQRDVTIELAEDQPTHGRELINAIQTYLSASGYSAGPRSVDVLPALVETCKSVSASKARHRGHRGHP